jgi:hypothetical protein
MVLTKSTVQKRENKQCARPVAVRISVELGLTALADPLFL